MPPRRDLDCAPEQFANRTTHLRNRCALGQTRRRSARAYLSPEAVSRFQLRQRVYAKDAVPLRAGASASRVGSTVIQVTNLNASGPGSLRAAVEASAMDDVRVYDRVLLKHAGRDEVRAGGAVRAAPRLRTARRRDADNISSPHANPPADSRARRESRLDIGHLESASDKTLPAHGLFFAAFFAAPGRTIPGSNNFSGQRKPWASFVSRSTTAGFSRATFFVSPISRSR